MRKYFIGSLCLVFLILFSCSNTQPELLDLEQDKLIQVYFNHRSIPGKNYTDPYRQIQRSGDNLEEIIIEAINKATSSIDIAVQELRLPKIAQALAESYHAGVKVRVILENNYSRPFSELTRVEINKLPDRDRSRYQEFFTLVDSDRNGQLSTTEINRGDALIILRNADIPVIDDTADGSKGSGLMHHKFIVIDRQIVVTGSANFTLSDIHGDFANPETRGNTNNLIIVNSKELAKIYTEEFNYMWGDGPGGNLDSKFGLAKPIRFTHKITLDNTIIEVQFSPISSSQPWDNTTNGLIGKALSNATKSINLALFVFSEQKLANILQQKQQQRITIQGVFEPEFALRYYSEALDLLGMAIKDNQCNYEANNNPWQTPLQTVGIAQLSRGDKLHHKFAIVDNRTVITGSHNWSAAANYNNDENALIIHNPTVAAHFQQEFERLYHQAALGISESVTAKIKAQQKKC
jgi:phosphatidylserine/phosphatidylglycerophosphate/cardiolipin synthase-like enzyme